MAEIRNNCSGGYYGNNYYIILEYFENFTNTENNYSNITLNAYIQPRTSSYSFYGTNITARLYADGALRTDVSLQPDVRNGNKVLLTSWTGNIYHDEQGNKTTSISAELIGPGGYAPTYGSVSTNWSLTKIYRGSVLGNIANFTIDKNENVGNSFDVPTTRYSLSYTDNLIIKIGNNTVATRNNFTGGQVTFTDEELTNIYSKMPSNSTVFTFVLQTFSGSSKIGNDSTKTATGTISATGRAPVFNDFDWEDIRQETVDLTGDPSIIIQKESTIQVSIPESKKATATKGASISKYIVTLGSNKSAESADLIYPIKISISQIDNKIITVYAVDNRGNSTPITKTISNFVEYFPIQIEQYSCSRSNNGIGEETTVKVEGTFFNQSFGNVDNDVTATYKFRVVGTSDWKNGTTPIKFSKQDNKFNINQLIAGDLGNTGFSRDESFEIQIIINDKLSGAQNVITLSAGSPAIAIYKNCVALGEAYDEQKGGRVQINGLIDFIYPVGSIYMSVNDINPSVLFGGTWEEWGSGQVPVGVDTSQTEFDKVEKTGGSKTKDLRALIGAYDSDIAKLGYVTAGFPNSQRGARAYGLSANFVFDGQLGWNHSTLVTDSDGNYPIPTMPPYITCYMWKRTA